MNDKELSWGASSLISFCIVLFSFCTPYLVEYLARNPDKLPEHRGKWVITWMLSIPYTIENSYVQLCLSAISIFITYSVSKFCICVGHILGRFSWGWLSRVFGRPNLEMLDDLTRVVSMNICFQFSLFLLLFLVSKAWGVDDPVWGFFFNWCQWLLYCGVFLLWIKWVLSRYYDQIEEWIDNIW